MCPSDFKRWFPRSEEDEEWESRRDWSTWKGAATATHRAGRAHKKGIYNRGGFLLASLFFFLSSWLRLSFSLCVRDLLRHQPHTTKTSSISVTSNWQTSFSGRRRMTFFSSFLLAFPYYFFFLFFFLNLLSSLQSSLILITSKPSTRNWNMSLADILFLLILFFVDQHHQQLWCWSSVVSVCLPNYTLLIFLFIFVVVCRIPSSRWIEIYEKHDGNARSNVNYTCNSHFPRPCRVSLPRRNNDVIQNPGHADLVLPDRLWTI